MKGRPVKLCADKAAAEAMLSDLIKDVDHGKAGILNPMKGSNKRSLADYGEHLAKTKSRSAYHASQVTGKLRRCLLEGCGFARLSDVEVEGVAEWLAEERRDGSPPTVPAGVRSFGVTEAAAVLGIDRRALVKRVR